MIKAGETTLECDARGAPVPAVRWVKDGQPVAGGQGLLLLERGRRLRIPAAELAHAGRYTCLVADLVEQEFEVVVHGKGVGWGCRGAGLGGC